MINQNRPIAQYYQEWTPIHEFSHLMLPFLDREQRWVSEGFAQYYQNVFLARAEQHSARDAWQKIYDGLERGRESAPGLSPNEAARAPMRDTRMKVYWSGASIALMADVELRRRSGGRQSLDSVLGELQQCCLPSTYAWSGVELFRKLDEFVEEPFLQDLYRRYADADEFPDARLLLEELGVTVRNGKVALDDAAALAGIRTAITEPAP
jgi:predicted metalloprotease with PDZ domain